MENSKGAIDNTIDEISKPVDVDETEIATKRLKPGIGAGWDGILPGFYHNVYSTMIDMAQF